jgi:hypothetical protein
MVKDAKTFQDGMMETATNTIAIGTRTAGRDVYLYDPEQCQDTTDGLQERHGKDCAWYEKETAHCLSLSLKFSNMGRERSSRETASQAPVIARSSLVCMINRL